eukprot:6516776-Pyramimonas_sp.AAC.1
MGEEAPREGMGAAERSMREIGQTLCEPLISERLSPRPHAVDTEQEVVVTSDLTSEATVFEGTATPQAMNTEAVAMRDG